MKWNWGTKIVISFILFGVFILYMVIQAFRQDIDLVSEDYYQDELNFQQKIDNKMNLSESGVEIAIIQQGNQIIFQYPDQFKEAVGKIYFYHTSRQLFDQTYKIAIDTNGRQSIWTKDLVAGRFRVKMDWEAHGVTYFQEKEFYIQ